MYREMQSCERRISRGCMSSGRGVGMIRECRGSGRDVGDGVRGV